MSDHKHTPEPWIIGKINHKKQRVDIDSRSPCPQFGYTHWEGLARTYGCEDESDVGSEVMVANARRIVACVNACAGISTDALERSKSLEDFMRSMKVIEQQRDELLVALEVAIDTPELQGGKWEELARTAIASVKTYCVSQSAAHDTQQGLTSSDDTQDSVKGGAEKRLHSTRRQGLGSRRASDAVTIPPGSGRANNKEGKQTHEQRIQQRPGA